MDIIFYFFAVLIVTIPSFFKNTHYLDVMPLFLFYFDATYVFINHPPSYQYFEYVLILLISFYYIFEKNRNYRTNNFGVYYFLFIAMLIFPLLQGVFLDPALRNFSLYYSSMILLPLGFNHYSKSGNINKLLYFTFLLIVFYALFVLIATPLRLGGFQSERVAGRTFYYGNIAMRGGITYISFVLLMIPLILIKLRKNWQKIVLLLSVIFILLSFLFVLKRFVFVVIGFGLLNHLLHPGLNPKFKFRIALFIVFLSSIYFFDIGLQKSVQLRYEERGGDSKFSESNIMNDLRIYEPFYVTQAVLKKPIVNVLIGEKNKAVFDIEHDRYVIKGRKIHNTYARFVAKIGIIGLFLYLFIYFSLYRYVRKIYRLLKKRSNRYLPYWIVFQNLVIIFLFQGMVGGHIHVTLRGLVFLYLGAIAGYFYRVLKESVKLNQINEKIKKI